MMVESMIPPEIPPERIEEDSLGKVKIPRDKYWGPETQRSLQNFRIGGERFPHEFIRALGIVKKACCKANHELGLLSSVKAEAIGKACDEVIAGKWDEHFPLVIWQTGSGTQTHMNANEVIANRAIEIMGGALGSKSWVHPHDDVNLGQSTNDGFPTAMHIAVVEQTHYYLIPALEKLHLSLFEKSALFKQHLKVGRTHLQDAVPITLGQEFSGYSSQIKNAIRRVRISSEDLLDLAQGGTAVGTGLNASPEFSALVAKKISEITQFPFRSSPNKFELIASHDALVFFSGALTALAAGLTKIANDIRWLASGPRCGLNELSLPSNEPGSSMMPGKVNPTQCEAVLMVCVQVMSHHFAITMGDSQGNFELNTFKPLLIYNLLNSIRLLSDVTNSFSDHCVSGISVNERRLSEYLKNTLMLATALAPHIGYDHAAKISRLAYDKNITLKEAALQLKLVSPTDFEQWTDPKNMIDQAANTRE